MSTSSVHKFLNFLDRWVGVGLMAGDTWRQKIPLEMRARIERQLELIINGCINPKPAEVLHQLMTKNPDHYSALVEVYGNPNSEALHEMVRRRIDKSGKPRFESLSAVSVLSSESGRVEFNAVAQNNVNDNQIRLDSGSLQPMFETVYMIKTLATVVINGLLVEVASDKILTAFGTVSGRYVGSLY